MRKSRWFRAILTIVLSALLLEVVLQSLYLGHWLLYPRATREFDDEARVVMCIGDSFTFGEGATRDEFAYPPRAQAVLRDATDENWRFANYGWPGRNSRQLLERVETQLQECHPEFVCVLVGANDTWSRPERLDLGEAPPAVDDDAFRWEYRTARLMKIFSVLNPYEDEVLAAETSAMESNTAETSEAPAPATRRSARAALQSGDYHRAETEYHELLAAAPAGSDDETWFNLDLLAVYAHANREERFAQFEWLQAEHRRAPRATTAQCLLLAMERLKMLDEGLVASERFVEDYPDSAAMWWRRSCLAFHGDEFEIARSASDRTIELLDRPDQVHSGPWHIRARIYESIDRREAMRCTAMAFSIDQDVGLVRIRMQRGGHKVSPEDLNEILADTGIPHSDRDKIIALHRDPNAFSGEDPESIYRHHLEQILSRCRAAGAEPVLVTYPFGHPMLKTVRDLAHDWSLDLVPVHEHFRKLRAANPDIDYFASDGHCNDAGYGVMGELVARAIHEKVKTN